MAVQKSFVPRAIETGEIVYSLQWEGDCPNLISGRVIRHLPAAVVIEEADGCLFSSRRFIPIHETHHDPGSAVNAEEQWLRWFAPYDRMSPSEQSAKRSRRLASLDYLKRILPCAAKYWHNMNPAA